MPNEMRDRIVELMVEADAYDGYECKLCTDDHSCFRCYFTKLADHLIENGEIIPQWISVKDRLPEQEGQQYLCASYYKTTNSWHINLYWFSKDLYKFNDLDFSDKKGVSGFWDSDSEWGCCHHENVTHWMPLPEPPKTEQKEGNEG